MTKSAAPRKSQTVHDLPLDYLRCRAFVHHWEEFVPRKRKPSFGFRISLLCTSCGTERHDIIDTVGGLADRQYTYPDGYQLEAPTDKGEARLLYEKKRPRKYLARRGTLTVSATRAGVGA